MKLGQQPRPTPGKKYERFSIDKKTILFAIILVLGISSIGFLASGGLASVQSLYTSNFGGPEEIPEIALNPPKEEDRQNLTDSLMEEGYKKEDIGVIKDKDEEPIRIGGDYPYLYSVDSIPEIIPVSESVGIRNLRIVGKDSISLEVVNFASYEVEMPFYRVNAIVLTETEGDPYKLKIQRIAGVEIDEEPMAPGEIRTIEKTDLFQKIGDHVGIEIESVWISYEDY